ncbi:MAG: pentapeptide repeat-containing protein [Xenococcus sp. (in: cyanobacteria)]
MFGKNEEKEKFEKIYDTHLENLNKKDKPNSDLIKNIQALLEEIGSAGRIIADPNQRQLLKSYAEYWSLYLYEVNHSYPKVSLEPLDDKIKQILTFYGEEEQLEIQDFLFSSLKQIAIPDFKEILMSFVWETLAYYWENFEEVEQVERSIFCLCQVAYLKSLYDIIINFLDEEVKSSLSDFLGNRYIYELFAQQLSELDNVGWKLDRKCQSREETSEQGIILYLFYECKLAEVLEQGFKSFIETEEYSDIQSLLKEIKLLDRVKRNTYKHIIKLLQESGDLTKGITELWIEYCSDIDQKKLKEKYQREANEENISIRELTNQYLEYEPQKHDGINQYLKYKIAGKFDNPEQATVFHEPFTFKDIYVDLKYISSTEKDPDLKDWAIKSIQTREKRDQVLCIEGEAGSGKSIFCRMLADWTLKHLHPLWTPILIKLRDIKELGNDFQETLEIFLSDWKFTNNHSWLKDQNTCFLFLLDGLDELLTEKYPELGWNALLKQAIEFQHEYGLHEELPKHQVLITTSSVVFQSPSLSFEDLERVKIQPVDRAFLHEWLETWKKLESTEKIQDLENILNAQLERSSELEKGWLEEPLLLYLVAAMWRDDSFTLNREEKLSFQRLDKDQTINLSKQEFEKLNANDIKSLIYETLLDWVIDKQLPPWLQNLIDKENQEQNKKTLKIILTEAGLFAIQSGGTRSSMEMLKERLEKRLSKQSKTFANDVIEQTKREATETPTSVLLNIKNNQVNFLHKSFSEFLYAQRLLESLEDWTKLWENKLEFVISRDRMDWEIYDLLGFGGLTPEIMEYLRGSLKRSEILRDKSRQEQLLERLKDFYRRWFEGKFVNEEISTTWPEKKMVELQKQMSSKGLFLGRRLIDIYTGLNVLILLLDLSRQNQESPTRFYPCGSLPSSQCAEEATFSLDKQTDPFDPSRLLRIIGYSRWLGTDVFVKTVGSFLEKINLRGADLRGAELSGVKLNKAYLSDSLLNGINLSGAELKQAFLGNAQLHCADLSRTNLTSAFLGNANLSGAYLEKATLVRAVLAGANLRTAHLVNANCKDACLGDADLSDANLRGAKLKNANFSCSNLSDANLQGADLSGADLTSSVLTGCNFSDANLTSANLTGANLKNIIWNKKTQWNWETLQYALIDNSLKEQNT